MADMAEDSAVLAAIAYVDKCGDVCLQGGHDPRHAALRASMMSRHYIAWDGAEGRYYVTSIGREFQMRPRFGNEPARGQVVSFRRPMPPKR